MNSHEATERLAHKGIKATANRILVMEALGEAGRPQSLTDLEQRLLTMDKSSIFRTLSLFREHDVVHVFEDGRGSLCYELCLCEGACRHHDAHIHFYCERCQRSFCLEHADIPSVELPEGFSLTSVSFVVKGICAECAGKCRV